MYGKVLLTKKRQQEFDISKSSVQRILTKDLHFHAYKIQLTQLLKPTHHADRREFIEWIMERQEDADFSNKIIFSDEVDFHLHGFVN